MRTAGIQLNLNLSNCEVARKKFFGASKGFEPVASAFALYCSTSWAMETHTLRAGQFIGFINPWKEWNKKWNDVNCGNTKWNEYVAIAVESQFKQCEVIINWPALSVRVFTAQLAEHCSANAEATGSNPVEAPKTFFGLLPSRDSTAMVTYSFQMYKLLF